MKRYIKSSTKEPDGFGVMTQDNYTAHYNLVCFSSKGAAERWRDKLIENPTTQMLNRAARYGEGLWDDAISDKWLDDKYYTDASGYSDDYIQVVNRIPIIIE